MWSTVAVTPLLFAQSLTHPSNHLSFIGAPDRNETWVRLGRNAQLQTQCDLTPDLKTLPRTAPNGGCCCNVCGRSALPPARCERFGADRPGWGAILSKA